MSLTEVPPEQLTAILARAEALKQQRLDDDKCRDDFEHFSQFLQIRPKGGSLVPFVLNPAQRKILHALEEQRAKTGRTRTIILKGRQVGCTTLIAAIHFHQMIYRPGLRTAIMAHERQASSNIREMLQRFYDQLLEDRKPLIAVSNAHQLTFDKLDSGFLIYVAGLEGSGRSATVQCLLVLRWRSGTIWKNNLRLCCKRFPTRMAPRLSWNRRRTLRGPEIDDQLDFCGLGDWKLCRVLAL